jgi:cyanate permease
MLTLVWLLYFSFGMVYRAASPLVSPMLRDLKMSYGQMGVVLGSWQLTYVGFAMIAGFIIDKWGIRKSLFFGTVVIGVSAALRYFAVNFSTLLPAVALFGIGGPMISIGAPKTISMWFRGKDRGTAVGVYITAPWVGGIVGLSATNTLVMPLTQYSWRLTFVSFGILTFLIAGLWFLLAKDHPFEESNEEFGMGEVFLRLIDVREVRLIIMAGLLTFSIMHGLTSWLPKILETKGLSPSMAGYGASIPLLGGIFTVLLVPRAVPNHWRGHFIGLLSLIAALGITIFALAPGYFLLPGLILFGGAGSTIFPLLTLTLMEIPEVGARYMGAAGGIFFCAAEIGGFLGPLLMGLFVDFTNSFFLGPLVLATFYLFIFLIAFMMRRKAI